MANPDPENEPTRRIDPPGRGSGSSQGPDATRRIEPPPPGADTSGWDSSHRPWEATSDPTRGAYRPGRDRPEPPEAEPPSQARRWLFGLLGALLGFMLAFLVIAISTDDEGDGAELAGQERIEALETELAERDAQMEALQARLDEAEAAAGERDEDLEAQRQALDERAGALDERSAALDEREAALDERETAIEERERDVTEPSPGGEPADPAPGDGPPLDDVLPDVDEQTVENIVERVLDRLRNLL